MTVLRKIALTRVCTALVLALLAAGAASLLFARCASLPPKQVATTDVQQVETLLGTVQDTATALCVPNPPTHCTAAGTIFTDATWHALNVALAGAFEAQKQLATGLLAWTPGTGTPPSTATVAAQVSAVIAAIQTLPVSTNEGKILAAAQAVLAEVQTVATLISQSASASAGS